MLMCQPKFEKTALCKEIIDLRLAQSVRNWLLLKYHWFLHLVFSMIVKVMLLGTACFSVQLELSL